GLGFGLLFKLYPHPDMALFPGSCQFHLALTLRKALLLLFGVLVVAMMATDAFYKMFGLLVFCRQRHATGTAEFVIPRFQAMTDRDTLIKHEAITLPQASVFWNRFQ